MREPGHSSNWRNWLRIGRLVPLMTILVAMIVGIMSLLGLFQATLAEGIIITLLAFLAFDALVERLSLLEKIDTTVTKWTDREFLKDRSELVRMKELAAGATEICAAGISLISIIRPYDDFYIQKLRDGCNMRFLLLEPDSDIVMVWDEGQLAPGTKNEIETSLRVLDNLIRQKNLKGKCEVRVSRAYLPFSIVIVDGEKDRGMMTVEMLVYKKSLAERPHFQLLRREQERWFQFFYDQFERRWREGRPWHLN